MNVTLLAITPEGGLKRVEPGEVHIDLDAMPKHKKEAFFIGQLNMIRKWAAEQESKKEAES